MRRYLAILLFVGACAGHTDPAPPVESKKDSTANADTIVTNSGRGTIQTNYPALLVHLRSADSIVIASHDSPNMQLMDKKTGKYRKPPELIINGQVNDSAIHERKRLSGRSIDELGKILTTHTVDNGIYTTCFQPRHAVFIYKNGQLSYLDICFDCSGNTYKGDLGSPIIFNQEKYRNMYNFFWKQGFRFELG